MTKEESEEQLSSIPKTVRDYVREKVKEAVIDMMTIEEIQKGNILADINMMIEEILKGNILADFVEKYTSIVINDVIKEYGDEIWKKISPPSKDE